MKRVLLVAYHYPPVRAGAERALRLSEHLPAFGYRPTVLTTSAFGRSEGIHSVRAWEPLSLYRRLCNPRHREEPEVRTTGRPLTGLVPLIRRCLLIPDAQVGWIPHAVARGLRLIRTEGIDLLFTTYPPASSHLVGMALKRITGLPWVADFRDCWTYDPLDDSLSGARLEIETELESWVVEKADRVSVVTGVASDHFRSRYIGSAPAPVLIPNGYEPPSTEGATRYPRRGARLRMVHTGAFSRSHPRRSPAALFEALRRMENPPELILAGVLTEEERRMAGDLVARGIARLPGSLSRAEAAQLRNEADLLLLVDHPRRVRASNVPAKFYEYAATGRPILALTPEGAVRDLMAHLGAGRTAQPDDPAAIRTAIEAYAEEWERGGELRSEITPEALAPYRWQKLTERMAAMFDEIIPP